MTSKFSLITTSLLVLAANAQSSKYIISSRFSGDKCNGNPTETLTYEAGKCYYYQDLCSSPNPTLVSQDTCNQLKLGNGLNSSFQFSCTGSSVNSNDFEGNGCIQRSGRSSLSRDECFKFFDKSSIKVTCSDDPNHNPNLAISVTAAPIMIFGILTSLFLQ